MYNRKVKQSRRLCVVQVFSCQCQSDGELPLNEKSYDLRYKCRIPLLQNHEDIL